MEIRGRVHNGVVVLEGELPLPEGTEVIVSSGAAPETKPVGEQRIDFPLVRSKHPGSLQLTGQRVAEFLEEAWDLYDRILSDPAAGHPAGTPGATGVERLRPRDDG